MLLLGHQGCQLVSLKGSVRLRALEREDDVHSAGELLTHRPNCALAMTLDSKVQKKVWRRKFKETKEETANSSSTGDCERNEDRVFS